MTEWPLHDAAEAALARLTAGYRIVVDEKRERAQALDVPPGADLVRVLRLVPEGTDGESLTVVLTGNGGVALHVRRTLERELGPGEPGGAELLREHLLDLPARLGWTPR